MFQTAWMVGFVLLALSLTEVVESVGMFLKIHCHITVQFLRLSHPSYFFMLLRPIESLLCPIERDGPTKLATLAIVFRYVYELIARLS